MLAGELFRASLARLQNVANTKLQRKLSELAAALDEDYEVSFELITTGKLTESAQDDFETFQKQLAVLGDKDAACGSAGEQDYARRLADAFRHIRNSLAHGEVLLDPNLDWAFSAVRDMINQLFPAPAT
jgi:hypothetical protein